MSLEKCIESSQPDEQPYIPEVKFTGIHVEGLDCPFCLSAIIDGEPLELYQMQDGRKPLHVACKEAYEEQQYKIKYKKEDEEIAAAQQQLLQDLIPKCSDYLNTIQPTGFSLKRTAYLLACAVVPGFAVYSTQHVLKECDQMTEKSRGFFGIGRLEDRVYGILENSVGEVVKTASLSAIYFQTDPHIPLIFIFGSTALAIAVGKYKCSNARRARFTSYVDYLKTNLKTLEREVDTNGAKRNI